MKRLLALLAFLFIATPALASNCPTYPYTLTNGQTADANQVMANFNSILACANTLPGSPVAIASGGTGSTTAAGAINNLGALTAANNLSDLPSASNSRANLGVSYGTTAGSVAQGNDSRFGGPTVNIQAGSYQLVALDAGKQIQVSTASPGQTLTIPANGSVAFAVGTKIEVVNLCTNANSMSIAITSDTLYWAPSATTGTRTLAICGIATLTKVTTTTWMLTGAGVS